MNKKEEIQDSLEFCKDIKLYTKPNSTSSSSEHNNTISSSSLKEYVDWINLIEHTLSEPPSRNYLSPSTSIHQTFDLSEEEKPSQITNAKALLKDVYSFAICMVVAFVIAYFITSYVGQHTRVEGASMEDTLHNNDYLIIDKLSYHMDDPDRFDIIIFPYEEGVYYVKRIIGMPGESVLIKDGEIYINDVLLREDYGTEPMNDPGDAISKMELADDEYFVLGDNRNNSKDSRRSEVGLIKRGKIVGKACFRFFPFHRIGVINN